MEALKKELTKLVADCIIIINRKEENGTLSNMAGADIVELMGKTCDYLFSKEPELLREVHEIMEPAIKLFSEELKEQKDIEFKLFSEKLNEQNDKELNQYIQNCILQCKSEGKNKLQTEQILQKIFSLNSKAVKEMLENFQA